MMGARLAWISHPDCLVHSGGAWHPECPERLSAIEDHIKASSLLAAMHALEAPLAERETLVQVHAPEHVDQLWRCEPADCLLHLDADTFMGPGSLAAARRAAGANVLATQMVLDGAVPMAFCAVRPPGHHAERGRAMGFCLFNNVAVAAGIAMARGLERIAILDFDVHYGNGTSCIFAGEPRVQVFSTYQEQLYPYWIRSDVANLIDVPLAPSASGMAFRGAVESGWLPALERFRPQLLLVSAGFDAHHADPLGGLRLSEADFHWVGQQIADVAARHCAGRIVSTLEGGYNLAVLGPSVEAYAAGLLGRPWTGSDA